MNLKYGLVGLPNVGKSTLFNALTSSSSAEAANYPFCTIEPNLGRVPVPDPRLQKIKELIVPDKTIPNFIEFVDIAGLVKGASQGEGLGNKFLSHIRETNSFLHVVRCFKDENVTSVHNSTNPLKDIEIINLELLLSDIDTMEKSVTKTEKLLKGNASLKEEYEVSKNLLEHLQNEKAAREFSVEEAKIQKIGFPSLKEFLKQKGLLTAKPVLYACNVDEESLKNKDFALVDIIRKQFGKENVLVVCAEMEAQMSGLDDEEKMTFLKDVHMDETGLNLLIRRAYQQLNLITFFTAGKQEVRAWTLPKGALAPQAGAVIHSDFEKGFIKAEIYSYEDLLKQETEKNLKAKGLIRLEGKAYEVQDGDIIHFRFNV